MRALLKKHGFSRTAVFRFGKPCFSKIANHINDTMEMFTGFLPFGLRQKVSARLFQSVAMIAWA